MSPSKFLSFTIWITVGSLTVMAQEKPLERISFGSCAKQDKPQPIWDAIVAGKPELFIFLGDNIYGDSADMDVLRGKYQMLHNQPGFVRLKQTCPFVATWDDHDFGKDDSGAEYAMRKESQQVFLDFLGVGPDDWRVELRRASIGHTFMARRKSAFR